MPPLGQVHPDEAPRPSKSNAEKAVWKALKRQLPAGWRAWHSLRIRDGKGYLGEGDFVLAHPERGMIVLEVKGGHVEARDGRWFQNGDALDPAPLTQALDFQSKLLRRLRDFGSEPPAWGCAVALPETEFDAPPGGDDLSGAVLGATQLHWFAEYLDSIARRVLPPPKPARGDWIERLHKLWGETWVPSLSLGTRARLAAERRFELDDAQLAALATVLDNERVLVSGGAGSGKTLLAAEAARRAAADGKRVLLLCFTAPLQRWLAARLGADGVEVSTVSGLAKAIVDGAGVPVAGEALTSNEHWRATYERAVDLCEARWDAVVVDEGQDLTLEAWCLVEGLAKGRRLWAFHDPSQGYWHDRQPPRELFGATAPLPAGRRCPPGVEALAARYLGRAADERAVQRAVKDGTLALVECAEPGETAARVGREIDRLLAQGVALSDIGVVSLRGQTAADAVYRQPRLGDHAFVPADHPEAEERLVADSFLRWKGLERPAIIVADAQPDGRERFGTRMHIALTRALAVARIVGPRTGAEGWPGLP